MGRPTNELVRATCAALAICTFSTAACTAPEPLPNIVLISIDTLRADRLGAYGFERPTSPRIDALALEAVLFERAYTPASHTLPAHASLLTGLYPETHGVLRDTDSLAAELPTLAEVLARAGYRTGAFVNAGYLAPKFALDRGFEHYDFAHDWTVRQVDGETRLGRNASETNLALFDWIEESSEPFFAFVHYFDAHSDWNDAPYESPAEHHDRLALPRPASFRSGRGEVRASFYLSQRNRSRELYSPAERAYLASLYDAGVAYADEQLGQLLDRLRADGLWERSLIVVVSDHGEEFQEHGGLLHRQIFEELVRVPLLIRFPSGANAGLRVPEPVSLIDVAPSVLQWLGLETPDRVQGGSLLPLLGGDGLPVGPVFLRTREGTQFGVANRRWKLLVKQQPRQTLLFDLAADPGETRDVSRHHPRVRSILQSLLAQWTQTSRAARPAAPPPTEIPLELREALRKLGYTSD